MESENKKFEQIIQKIDKGSTLLEVSRLQDRIAANITLLKILLSNGQVKKVIVRVFGTAKIEPRPYIASNEFKLLQTLRLPDTKVPTPLYFDESGKIFSTPYVVLDYIEGKTEFISSDLSDFILKLTTKLSLIHSVDYKKLGLFFLPKLEDVITKVLNTRPAKIDHSIDEGRIRDTLGRIRPLPIRNKPVLLHGDFWLGNVLWKNNQIVGIIDWENAMLGDPVVDLAVSRIDFMMGPLGLDVMNDFTEHYKSMVEADFTYLPYWDLYAALRHASKISKWAKDEAHEKKMLAGHREFTAQAFEKCRDLY